MSGYARDIDWTEAMALDLLLLAQLVTPRAPGVIRDLVKKRYGDLGRRLGLVVATRNGVCDLCEAAAA